jgi:hypothetical protein
MTCVSFRCDLLIFFSTLGKRIAMLEAANRDEELKLLNIHCQNPAAFQFLIKYLLGELVGLENEYLNIWPIQTL